MLLDFVKKIYFKSNIDLFEYVCIPLILLLGVIGIVSFILDFIFVY